MRVCWSLYMRCDWRSCICRGARVGQLYVARVCLHATSLRVCTRANRGSNAVERVGDNGRENMVARTSDAVATHLDRCHAPPRTNRLRRKRRRQNRDAIQSQGIVVVCFIQTRAARAGRRARHGIDGLCLRSLCGAHGSCVHFMRSKRHDGCRRQKHRRNAHPVDGPKLGRTYHRSSGTRVDAFGHHTKTACMPDP